MLGQIQPHFLYNSLGTIQALCRVDPEKAEKAVGDFSRFLRHNMQSIENDQPILFYQELRHTQNYLALQKLRFGDDLKIETVTTNPTAGSHCGPNGVGVSFHAKRRV